MSRDPFKVDINKILLLFIILFFFGLTAMKGQSSDVWADEEDDETEITTDEWDVGPGNKQEVTIILNGEEYPLRDEVVLQRGDTLDIKVRYLRPSSVVAIHMKKAGVKLARSSFFANEKGQLDLEIKTGSKKIKGTAVIYYTPSGTTARKQREVRLILE